ncbi:MAG: tetratricopeptide repeat protein [Candidatus Heimdallarchaeaceae archaeon]
MVDYLAEELQKMFKDHDYTSIIKLAHKELNQEISNIDKKNYYFVLAKAHYFLGENKQAFENIKETIEILEVHQFPQKEVFDVKIEYAKILRRIGEKNQSMKIYSKLLELHESSLNDDTRAIIYHNLANLYMEQGNFEESKKLFQMALSIDQIYKNEEGQAHTFSSLGGLHFYLGEYDEAINYYFKSLNLRKQTKDILGEATVSLNLGSIYANQLNEELANEFLIKAEEVFKEIDHEKGFHSVLNTRARLNYSLKKYDQVIINLEYLETKEKEDITRAHISLIGIFTEALIKEKQIIKTRNMINLGIDGAVVQNKLDEALEILNELEEIGDEIKDKRSLIAIYHSKAQIYLRLGNHKQATAFAEQGRDLAVKYKDSAIVELLDLLFEIYLLQGDFRECIKVLKNISRYVQVKNKQRYSLILRTFHLLENIKLKNIKYEFSVLLNFSEIERSLYILQETLHNILNFSSTEKKEEILEQMSVRIKKDTKEINSENEDEPPLEDVINVLSTDSKKLGELSLIDLLTLLDSIFFSIKYEYISKKYLQKINWAEKLPVDFQFIIKQKQLVLIELLQRNLNPVNVASGNQLLEQKFNQMFTGMTAKITEFQDKISEENLLILLYLISSIVIDTIYVIYLSDKDEAERKNV